MKATNQSSDNLSLNSSYLQERACCYSCCLESRSLSFSLSLSLSSLSPYLASSLTHSLALSSSSSSSAVLHFDPTDWLSSSSLFSPSLAQEIEKYSQISLSLRSIPSLSSQALLWLTRQIGPKLCEITIEKCEELTWKELRKILSTSTQLHTLRFLSNSWINDQLIEQLTYKCNKGVRTFEFEKCSFSDMSLFQISKQCPQLQNLTLIHCPNITDAGLIELSKRVHLTSLHLGHSRGITDRGLLALLTHLAPTFTSLTLHNCPNITSSSLSSLYETTVAWGKKRNRRTNQLETFSITSNPNIDSNLLSLLSLSSPSLQTINLSDCSELNLLNGMKHFESLSTLHNLYLGPSIHLFPMEEFLDSLSCHCQNLRILHLDAISSFHTPSEKHCDEYLQEIFSLCSELDEISLIDLSFGVKTIEAICSYIPNVTKITLVGSSYIDDQCMRCLTVVCRKLTSLTIKNCKNVTDLGYTRCAHLTLCELDLSHNPQLDGSLLSCFSLSPLKSLILDNTNISFISKKKNAFETSSNSAPVPIIYRMTHITKCSLRSLSLQNNLTITVLEVQEILNHFVSLESLDLTGAFQLLPSIRSLTHHNPHLALSETPVFLGYLISPSSRTKLHRFQDVKYQVKKEHSARKIQQKFHSYKSHLLSLVRAREQLDELTTLYYIIKIQNWYRMIVLRRKHQKIVRSGYLITLAGHRFLNNKTNKQIKRMKQYYLEKLVQKIFFRWKKISRQLILQRTQRIQNQVLPRYEKRLLKRFWVDLQEKLILFHERKYYECASAVWEENILKKIINCWKKVIGSSRKRGQLLSQIFLLTVPVTHYNSYQQRINYSMATHFHFIRSIIPAWIAFRDDYVRTLKAEQLLPNALRHFRKTFLARVMVDVWSGWNSYIAMRKMKHELKRFGESHFPYYQLKSGFNKLHKTAVYVKRKKSNLISLLEYLKAKPLATSLVNLKKNVFLNQLYRRIYPIARAFSLSTSFGRLKFGCVRLKKWNKMKKIAIHTSNRRYRLITIREWRQFTIDRKNMTAYCWNLYLDRLQSKAIRALRENLEMVRAFKRKLEEDLLKMSQVEAEEKEREKQEAEMKEKASQLSEEEMEALRVAQEEARIERERVAKQKYEQFLRRIIRFQAISRGFTQRMVFRRYKIAAEWASQVLQNFGRRSLARKRFNLKIKRWILAERKKEEEELNRMRDEEVETRYYNIHDQAALLIQRTFRGWKGREVADFLTIVIQKAKGRKFFEDMKLVRKGYEREQRAAAAKELNRHRAATQIQSIVRGRIARKVVRKLRARREIERRVVLIQRIYRGRLARAELAALRRTAVHMDRYQAARRQRGLVLRTFGFKKRASQLSLSQLLDVLGLEPTSFNYRVHELYQELKEDFFKFIEIVKREKEIFRETRGKQVLVVNARRKYFKLMGTALKREDACIIIERGHKFYGYTGVIVRVDTSIPGQPLYEVRLDHTPRQTFVHMTTDGLSYYMEQPQPLSRILKYPNSAEFLSRRRPVVYTGSDSPDESKVRIAAAWAIQLCYRRYAARKRVKKRRYEVWIRQADAQKSLMNLLESTNLLTAQTYFLTGKLRLRPLNNILYDEIRHSITAARLLASKYLSKMGPAIKNETESKHSHRIKYLEKAALIADKNPFLMGWIRITTFRKVIFFFQISAGLINRSALTLKDMCGNKGIRQFAKRAGCVTGMNCYTFHEFYASPHVRFPNLQMFQGEWKGLPSISPLVPYGEGVVMFYDGWGFSREDKILQLTIICCRHLNATDVSSSDPFCEIHCNGKNLQTSVKWSSLNPDWNESFEIDVTNPSAVLNIIVKDKDYIGADDFMGQILLSLNAFADGKYHREIYQLKGEDVGAEESFDRGEIEISVRWTDRTFDDDIKIIYARKAAAVKIQAWARKIAALELTKKLKVELEERYIYIRQRAVQITNTCRIRLARKEFKRRLRRHKAAIKIQKRVRIRIARRRVGELRRRRNACIRIQAIARMYNAKQLLKRLRAERKKLLYCSARSIQTMVRRKLAIIFVTNLKKIRREERIEEFRQARKKAKEEAAAAAAAVSSNPPVAQSGKSPLKKSSSKKMVKKGTKGNKLTAPDGSPGSAGDSGSASPPLVSPPPTLSRANTFDEEVSVGGNSATEIDSAGDRKLSFELPPPPPVHTWIDSYGIDPEYYLRRNRRITMRIFKKMLSVKYTRLLTIKYGVVFVNNYPPLLTMEEEISKTFIRVREDFVNVIVPSCIPRYLSREDVIDMYGNVPREGFLHLDSLDRRKSVNMLVTMVQCMVRQHLARKQKMFLLRISEAIAKFQRIFRRRNRKQHHAAYLIQSLFYYARANRRVKHMKLEKTSAILIQCAFRVWRAKMQELDLRTVRGVRVLKYTPSLPDHGPKCALDCKSYTMWVVDSIKLAEIRVELPIKEAIDAIWIMTSTYEASPKYVSIGVVLEKTKREYLSLYSKVPIPRKKGNRWMKFPFKSKISKYFKISFEENYGDKSNISIRQIRFVRAKEQSATILQQPAYIILQTGPRLGDVQRVQLQVEAEGWPLPKYQWYRNGTLLSGETNPTIMIPLHCSVSQTTRSFRCSSCKNICRYAPKNAYQVICANCGYKFDYKDIGKYLESLKKLHELENKKLKDLDKQKETLDQMQNSTDESLKSMLPLMLEQIAVLQGITHELRIERYHLKRTMKHVNHFDGEGVYICAVTNKRGGAVPIKRLTVPAVVVIENPDRYPLKTIPVYTPRQQHRRRKWTVYSSIKGTFTNGRCQGIVTIRYVGGGYYEGPYIPDSALNMQGEVPPSARLANHWGLYRCPDGRTYEGNNVDNHFDPENIQGNYKVTLPLTGEVYEGMIVDEKFHGIGVFHYADGSIYEGEWHVNKRYGHGILTSGEGWIYEGNFDADMRHGDGIMWWPDGATYLGHMSHNKRHGQGVFISKVRDIYRGNFVDDAFEGKGELLYNDGSKYTGDFHNGKRHGMGLFINRFGTEYFGPFVDDRLHGDHVVKKIVEMPENISSSSTLPPISTPSTPAYEVSLCQYNMGDFVQLVGQSINPASTKQFIDLFEKDRKSFDDVYAMLITRYLPNAPQGIDTNHPEVQKILIKLRTEGGVLTGTDAIGEARQTIERIMPEIKIVRENIQKIRKDIEIILKQIRSIEAEKSILTKKFKHGMEVVEEELQKIELFWREDKYERRERFRKVVESLHKIHRDDWFALRNNRVPPPFLKKIMDAISYLLDLPQDWKSQQMLISDYLFNSLNGDEQALQYTYDCKLLQYLESYTVYEHCKDDGTKDSELSRILADPRFRRDSYYVESLGAAAPFLVDFVKINYPYLLAAREILVRVTENDKKRFAAYRLRNQHSKLHIEQAALQVKLEGYKEKLATRQKDLLELQKSLSAADDVLRYIDESYHLGRKAIKDLDYYEAMEKRIEAQRDRFAVEAAMERTLDGVLDKIEKEKNNLKLTMLAQGLEPAEEPDPEQIYRDRPIISDWINEEVYIQQTQLDEEGVGLGYSLDPTAYKEELSVVQLKNIMKECLENILLRLNDTLHEKQGTIEWIMRKGRKITKKFLYVLIWKRWKDEATRKQNELACRQWEEIWGEEEVCAKMSIQSKVNWRMSELARSQGKIWGICHPAAIEMAERSLAIDFLEYYRQIQVQPGPSAGSIALSYLQDESGAVTFDMKAQSLCYSRLYPSDYQHAIDEEDEKKAKEFASYFPDETSLNAFRILNGMCQANLLEWTEYAKHWRAFHSEEYTKTEQNQTEQMATKFKEQYVFHTHMEAAKITINELISQYMEDVEQGSELYPGVDNIYNAKSWGLKNQGMYRHGLKMIGQEYLSRSVRNWNELRELTLDFTKGSYFGLTDEMKIHSALDRFKGFRDRLEKKFAWLLGYYYYRRADAIKKLEELQTKDPSERILHNIRPSELKSYEKKLEKDYLEEKDKTEKDLAEIIQKITVWKTYFGQSNSDQST